ncbi:Transient receptor potential cation channel subfamily M member 2 [Schistosoma japonicum]|nr:Transient receptor potential cation channel subfamily M member 2 [Schistosoma japonicum]
MRNGYLRKAINAIKVDDLNTFVNVTRSANILSTFDFKTTEDTNPFDSLDLPYWSMYLKVK